MNSRFKISCFVLILIGSIFTQRPIQAEEKRYNLSIAALFKNEAGYLKEWIEYHLLAGVDHFYLYNNNSTDQYKKILDPYIKKGLITLIFWPDCLGDKEPEEGFKWALTTEIPAYENAIKMRAHETKWLLFLDVDEFLVLPEESKLVELLQKYDEHPGITLSSDCFDASKIDTLPRRKLLIETLEMTKAPKQNPWKTVSKTIFKPDSYNGFYCQPYAVRFKDQKESYRLKRKELRINRYANRYRGALHFAKVKKRAHVDNSSLSEQEISLLLDEDYEIVDQERAIYRFLPELLKKMGYGS